MILHTLCLSGWRCFGRKLQLGPLGPGLNIIHGPNGTGKSTLLEALSRGFLDAHGVKGRQIEAIAPWGRELSPAVTLEFSHAGKLYRVEKTFLAGAGVRLDVKVGLRFEPLAEGRAADERLRAMFTRNPPARGLAQYQHRGWTQVLWAAQSETRLAALSDDLVADLRGVLDAQLNDPLTQAVLETVASRCGRYFTAGGRPRRGQGAPEIDRWQGELRTIQEELVPVESELARHGTLSVQVQGLEDRQRELTAHQAKLKAERDALETVAARYREMVTRLDRQQSRVRETQALHRQLKQQQGLLETTAWELQEHEALVKTIGDEAESQRKRLEDLDGEALRWRREAEAVSQMATQAAELRSQAEAARKFLETGQRADRLVRTLSRVRKIEGQLQALAQQCRDQPGPDDTTLAQARSLQARHHVLEGRLAAQGATLELTAEQVLTLEVAQGESAGFGPGKTELTPGASISLQGTPEVAARIPGVARFTVKGAGEDWASLKVKLDGVAADLIALFKPFGAGRVEDLENLAARDRELTAQESQLRTERRTLLEGAQAESLEAELGAVRQVLSDIAQAHPQWTAQAPDGEALGQEAGRQQAQIEARTSAVETAGAKAQRDRDQARALLHTLEGRLGEARRSHERLTAKQAKLNAQIDQPELDRRIHQRLMAWEAARQACVDLERQVAAAGPDPAHKVEDLTRRLAETAEQIQRLRDEARTAQGELAALAARAPYSRVRDLKERARELEVQVARQSREREALALLHETLEGCRQAATADLTLPVARRAIELLHRIDPQRWRDLHLGDDFTPAVIRPARASESVALTELSGGEQEQLHLAVRLALAEVLAAGQPEMLVLDDPLPATDPQRLQRVKAILRERARHLQVVILTCHPRRYADLDDTLHFDLARLKAQAEGRDGSAPAH